MLSKSKYVIGEQRKCNISSLDVPCFLQFYYLVKNKTVLASHLSLSEKSRSFTINMDSERPPDIEGNKTEQIFLLNDTVHSFSWQQLTVTVKDRETRKAKDLICDVNGSLNKGTLRKWRICYRTYINNK